MSTVSMRLSVMMFLQFFIWGSWFVTLGTYLAMSLTASGGEIAMAYSTQSWGAIVAPFIVGLIADRYFNAEKILGVLHLIGAVLMYMLATATDFSGFYPFVLGYMIIYMPTLALVNAVSFGNMTDPSAEFSKVRVWGTVGWIVAGLLISFAFKWDSQTSVAAGALSNTFMMAAIASLLLGVYSFTLPSTPPAAKDSGSVSLSSLLGADALGLLKDRNFAAFFVASVLICIPLAFYYQNANLFLSETGVSDVTGKMTLGQVSEVGFMLLLPWFLSRFGIRLTLFIGMLAWVLRYALFALVESPDQSLFILLGIALHGICYDFFFVTGQIYTDSKAREEIRSSAQGMITLATYGVGMLIGFSVAGQVSDTYKLAIGHDWSSIWVVPAVLAAVVAVLFFAIFKKERQEVPA